MEKPPKAGDLRMPRNDDSWLPTRRTLLSKLKDWNDQASWREFFNLYWRLIYSIARQAGLSDAEAQDVVQETILTVAKQMPEFRYDPAKGSFKSWLRKTTQWRIKDRLRRRQREQRLEAPPDDRPDGPTPPAAVDDGRFGELWEDEWKENLLAVAVDRVKKQVLPKEFQVFDLCTNKGWEASRVAQALHLIRPRVYYLNRKVIAMIEREIEALRDEI